MTLAIYTGENAAKTETRFLGLEYKKLSLWKRFYFLMRTGEKYELISSASSTPSYTDRDQLKSFLENEVIGDNDVTIFKKRGKSYFVIRNDSILNAMRICS